MGRAEEEEFVRPEINAPNETRAGKGVSWTATALHPRMNMDAQIHIANPKQYPSVKATWERTDMPETPRSLPISVELRVSTELVIYAEPIQPMEFEGILIGQYQSEMRLVFDRDHIMGANIYLMPDIGDDADSQWINEIDMSIAEIRVKDPFDVVPCFNCVFTAKKCYWFKLLAKLLRENLGVDVKITEEDQDKRKRRDLSANH